GFYPKTPQPRLRGFSLCPGFRQGVLALLRPCASVNVCVLQTTVTSMRCSASILISAACVLLLPVANAAELPRVDVQGATGMCKASTFAFSQNTRYRPLAVVNESGNAIFV